MLFTKLVTLYPTCCDGSGATARWTQYSGDALSLLPQVMPSHRRMMSEAVMATATAGDGEQGGAPRVALCNWWTPKRHRVAAAALARAKLGGAPAGGGGVGS